MGKKICVEITDPGVNFDRYFEKLENWQQRRGKHIQSWNSLI